MACLYIVILRVCHTSAYKSVNIFVNPTNRQQNQQFHLGITEFKLSCLYDKHMDMDMDRNLWLLWYLQSAMFLFTIFIYLWIISSNLGKIF